jgi:erythromycin esterase-like protein
MKFLSTAACWLFCSTTFGQDIRSYVTTNTVRVATLDAASDEFADLAAVGQAIGEARVVMLGEQDHGDGPTFQAKTRLVKYLHEHKGFTVLAFESDFYGLTIGWNKLAKQPDSIQHFLQRNIFSHWTNSEDCRYLFEQYIPQSFQTSSPLLVTGFDPQLYLTYSRTHLQKELDRYLVSQAVDRRFPSTATYQEFLVAVQGLLEKEVKPEAYRPGMRRALEDGFLIIRQAPLTTSEAAIWQQVLDNLHAFMVKDDTLGARDKAMADNLQFLLTSQYKNAKVIVWAHNEHIMKYTNQLSGKAKGFDKMMHHKMGTYFVQDPLWAQQTYVLGFASYQGTAGRLGTISHPVQAPDVKGLETWVPANIAYGFLDFTSYNKQFNYPVTPFLLKSPWHFTIPARVSKIPWNLVYDGLFFIREMQATKKIK